VDVRGGEELGGWGVCFLGGHNGMEVQFCVSWDVGIRDRKTKHSPPTTTIALNLLLNPPIAVSLTNFQ